MHYCCRKTKNSCFLQRKLDLRHFYRECRENSTIRTFWEHLLARTSRKLPNLDQFREFYPRPKKVTMFLLFMNHLQALSLKRTGQRGQAEQQRNLEVVELIRINIYLITPEISCPITLLHQSVLIIANCLWAQCEGSHTRHQQSIEPKMISDVFSNQIWSVLIRSHLISIDPLTETRYDTDLSLWLIHLWNIGTQFY